MVTGVTQCFGGSHAESLQAKRGKLSGKLQKGEAKRGLDEGWVSYHKITIYLFKGVKSKIHKVFCGRNIFGLS